jgi:regulator of protease activity HflC (stomatin/prohibitin superfamily)
MLLTNFIFFFGSIALTPIFASLPGLGGLLALSVPLILVSFFFWFGFFTLNPNEAAVVIRFGTYLGTIKSSGYFWCFPFNSLTRISLRSKNLNGQTIKVNDKLGNPIEIAIVVVWRVKNTAKAIFDVESYENFVLVNSESAVRHLALCYPYDKVGDNEICLRSGHETVVRLLVEELN